MTRPVDRQTITLLTDRCAARGRCRVYFDLAPSGRVHPGILRALLYARQLSGELAQAGIGCEILIRVNDRAPVRGGVSAERRNAQPGRRWRDFSDPATGKAYPELFRDELDAILRAIGVDARVLDASTIYNDPAFQNLAWEIVDRHRFFPQMRQTVYPVSRATGRMYVTETIWRDGRLTALCLESRQSQIVARDFDGGLIGYRLENALMWRHFGIDLDLHAANQSFNYHGSAQISHALFGAIAVPPRLGIVLGDDGKMVSKSRCNFLPVFEAISKHGPDALRQYLSQRPWWRDLPARR